MNQNKLVKLLTTLVVMSLLTMSTVFAQVYVDASNGKNSNDGTAPTQTAVGVGPVETIAKAYSLLPTGGTIYIAVGDYNEALVTIANPINFIGYIPNGSASQDVVIANGLNFTSTGTSSFDVQAIGTDGPNPARRIELRTATALDLNAGTVNVASAGALYIASGATITRKDGMLTGTPAYSSTGNYTVVYENPSTNGVLTVGPELPNYLGTGVITNNRLQYRPMIIPSSHGAITFATTGGAAAINNVGDGAGGTTEGDLTINVDITLTDQGLISNPTDGNITINGSVNIEPATGNTPGQLVNAGTGTLEVTGDVNVNLTTVAAPNAILNSGAGTLSINGNVVTKIVGKNNDLTASIVNSGALGTLTINGAITSPTYTGTGGVTYHALTTVTNSNTGTLTFGSSTDSRLRGTLTNTNASGTVVLNGNLGLGGAGAAVTIINNAGTIDIKSNTLDLVYVHTASAAATITNTGKITGTSTTLGTLKHSCANTGANVGTLVLDGNNGEYPSFYVNSTNVVSNTAGDDIVINGKLDLPKGTINILAGDIFTVKDHFTMNGGTLVTTGAAVLNLQGNFDRTSGTYTYNVGSIVRVSGPANQYFAPGANFTVYNFDVATTNNSVVTLKQSMFVKQNFSVTTGIIDLSTFNIRMKGNAVAPATVFPQVVNNTSGYRSSGGGSVVFEGAPGNAAETVAQITGAGTFSNLEINLPEANDRVDVSGGVKVSGTITLTEGDLRVDVAAATDKLTLTNDLVKPTIVKNTKPTTSAKIVDANGSANGTQTEFVVAPSETYNLVYTGAAAYDLSTAGAANILEWIPASLYDFTVNTPGFAVKIPAAGVTLNGALYVVRTADLDLNSQTLTAKKDTTHYVYGEVKTGNFKITGNTVTIKGDNVGPTYGENVVDGLEVAPTVTTDSDVKVDGLYAVTGLMQLTKGNLTVTMGQDNDLASSVARKKVAQLTVTGGKLTLGSAIELSNGVANNFAISGGVLNFATNPLIYAGTGTVQVTQLATFEYDSEAGRLVMNNAGSSLTSTPSPNGGMVAIPNVEFAANTAINDNTWISNAIYHSAGVVTVGAGKKLQFTGSNVYEYGAGTFAGATGVFELTSKATLSTDGGYSFTNFTQKTGTDTLTIKSVTSTLAASTTDRVVTAGTYTLTSGHISLGINDLATTAAFTRTAGTISGNAGSDLTKANTLGDDRGELVISSGNFTPGADFVVPNLRTAGMALQGTNDVTVTGFFEFGQTAAVTHASTGRISMGQGATIIRTGSQTMSQAPKFNSAINYIYVNSAAAAGAYANAYVTGKELTADESLIQNFTVNVAAKTPGFAGGGAAEVLLAANTEITVNNNFDLRTGVFGLLQTANTKVTVPNGKLVSIAQGTLDANASAQNPSLVYADTVNIKYYSVPGTAGVKVSTADRTWPNAAVVNNFYVELGDANLTSDEVILHESRSVENLMVNNVTSGSNLLVGDDTGTLATKLTVNNKLEMSKGHITTENPGAGTAVSTLEIKGDVAVTGGGIGDNEQGINLSFIGTGNQNLTIPSAGTTVNNLTLNQTGTSTVTLSGGDLTIGGTLTFINGVLKETEAAVEVIITGTINRLGVTGVSHIFGDVQRAIAAATGRYEFPVGSETEYRPFVAQFNTAPLMATNLKVAHVDANPGGTKNFPLDGGNVKISNYPDYYWLVEATQSLGAATEYDLEMTAANINNPFETVDDFRIIRRFDGDVATNGWSITGTNDTYTNILEDPSDTTVTVRNRKDRGGLVTQATIYTFGLPATGPVFTAHLGTVSVVEGDTVKGTYAAKDPDLSETATMFAKELPEGATFDAKTGEFQWITDNKDQGNHVVRIGAFSGTDTTVVVDTIKVTNSNEKPEFTAVAGNTTARFGQEFKFEYKATDKDGEDLTFMLGTISGDTTSADTTAKITEAGVFTWTPLEADSGKTVYFAVKVTDGIDTVSTVDTITVTGNRAPVIDETVLPDTVVFGDGTPAYAIQLVATDADGDDLTWELLNDTKGLELTADGMFNWDPAVAGEGTYLIKIKVTDTKGASDTWNKEIRVQDYTGITSRVGDAPENYFMNQNYPNPFNPTTKVKFGIKVESTVKVLVYNVLGQQVRELANETMAAGTYVLDFDASDLPSGMYIYRIKAVAEDGSDEFIATKKAMLVK